MEPARRVGGLQSAKRSNARLAVLPSAFLVSYSPAVIERIATSQRLANAAVRRHIARDPDISADSRTVANGNSPQDCRAGIDDDIVFDDRMARIALDQRAVVTDRKPLGAQCHRLVQPHALA